MDDYVHCFMAFINAVPHQTIASAALPVAVSHTLAALLCPAPQTVLVCLDTLALLAQRMQHAEFKPFLQPVFAQYAKGILALVLAGMVQGYPDDGFDQVPPIVYATVTSCPPEDAIAFAAEALKDIPGNALPVAEKEKFAVQLHEYVPPFPC